MPAWARAGQQQVGSGGGGGQRAVGLDVPADEGLLEPFTAVGSAHLFALGGTGEPVTDVGARELLERGQPADGVLPSGHAAALPTGFPASGQFHVGHVLSCRDTHAVGADVEGVHDPHAGSVEVCADGGVDRPDVASSAADEVSGFGERLGDVEQPLVGGAVARPALPDLGAVHPQAHRLESRHGDTVDRACGSMDGLREGSPEFGGGLDDLAPGAQHCRRVLPGDVHEGLAGAEVGIQ